MAAGNTMETVLVIGVIGAGGYLVYEYSRYSSAMNTIAQTNGVTVASLEGVLPFFTWLGFNWGGSGGGSQQQQLIYSAMQGVLSGTTSISTQAPGTTAPNQPTTVSTTPPTTSTKTASSSPSVSPLSPARAPASGILAPTVSSRLPAGTTLRRTTTITRTNAPVKTKI